MYHNEIYNFIEELESILNTILIKEELQSGVEDELKEAGFKLGMLTDEFMNIYSEFTKGIVEELEEMENFNIDRWI